MDLNKFNQLNLKDKSDMVFKGARRFISARKYRFHSLVLYDMGGFFAEVWYSPAQNQITDIFGLSLDDKKVNEYINSENSYS